MHKIAFAVTLFAGAAFTADRQITYQGDLSPLNIKPAFDHGYVIVWDRNIDGDKQIQTISVFGRDGSRLYNTAIRLPNRKYISPLNGADSGVFTEREPCINLHLTCISYTVSQRGA